MPSKYKKRNTAYLHQPHSGKKAPEPEGDVALKVAMGTYGDDNAAREFLEKARWKDGAFCPHCGGHEVTKLQGKSTRPGLYKCKGKACRKQFTVTVGTIFESSHIKLRHWVVAFHAMCSSKKGVSAHQLHRELGITYKSAWFMCHRIRHAMDQGIEKKLEGVVEADEAWMGGKPRNRQTREDRTVHTRKAPVVVLVERDGKAICKPVKNVSVKEISDYILANVSLLSALMTDESGVYTRVRYTRKLWMS